MGSSSYGIPFPLGGGGLADAYTRNILDDIVLGGKDPLRQGGTQVFEDSVKLELLQLHYILGQIWCMGEAYNSYKIWMDSNPAWTPDVIWCTRPDAYTWFPDDVWHKMKVALQSQGGIHTSMVGIQVLRPVEGLTDAVTETLVDPSAINMKLLNEYIAQRYVYPVPTVDPDSVSIGNTWNDIMSD